MIQIPLGHKLQARQGALYLFPRFCTEWGGTERLYWDKGLHVCYSLTLNFPLKSLQYNFMPSIVKTNLFTKSHGSESNSSSIIGKCIY